MPHLERVPQIAGFLRFRQCTATKAIVMLARDIFRLGGIAGQDSHEAIQAVGVEAICSRQLPEERTRQMAQGQNSAGEEISERVFGAHQLQVVGDEATALYCE